MRRACQPLKPQCHQSIGRFQIGNEGRKDEPNWDPLAFAQPAVEPAVTEHAFSYEGRAALFEDVCVLKQSVVECRRQAKEIEQLRGELDDMKRQVVQLAKHHSERSQESDVKCEPVPSDQVDLTSRGHPFRKGDALSASAIQSGSSVGLNSIEGSLVNRLNELEEYTHHERVLSAGEKAAGSWQASQRRPGRSRRHFAMHDGDTHDLDELCDSREESWVHALKHDIHAMLGGSKEPLWVETLKHDLKDIFKKELSEICEQYKRHWIDHDNILRQDLHANFESDSTAVAADWQNQSLRRSNSNIDMGSEFEPRNEFEEWELNGIPEHAATKLSAAAELYAVPALLRKWIALVRNWKASQTLPNTFLARVVSSTKFFMFFMFCICVNALWIGYASHIQVNDVHFTRHLYVRTIDFVFTGIFTAEIFLKLAGLRWLYFVGPSWKWNLLDASVIFLSLPNQLLNTNSLWFADILLVARLARVFKVVRVLSVVKELRKMLFVLYQTLITLFWVFAIFLFFFYCFAIIVMQFAITYIEHASTPQEKNIVEDFRVFYGSMDKALMTNFWMLSGGDWYEVVKPLERMYVGYKYLFACYMFFMVFGMLNVVIGTFCEKASFAVESDTILRTMREKDEATSFVQEMSNIFHDMDVSHTGLVNEQQFLAYIEHEFTGHYLRSHGIATHAPRQLFHILDSMDGDVNGTMDRASFVSGMQRVVGNARGTDAMLLKKELHDVKTMLKRAMLGRKSSSTCSTAQGSIALSHDI